MANSFVAFSVVVAVITIVKNVQNVVVNVNANAKKNATTVFAKQLKKLNLATKQKENVVVQNVLVRFTKPCINLPCAINTIHRR